ncbi:hypothetical protein WIS52_22015 [Pseudonocardia nematodicida]|uniref:Uncharacterized protein n=1 Tax=Pseudonocardia nematodicida TaxID=1206997 RepID=A0ABV1KFB9_9PSEU
MNVNTDDLTVPIIDSEQTTVLRRRGAHRAPDPEEILSEPMDRFPDVPRRVRVEWPPRPADRREAPADPQPAPPDPQPESRTDAESAPETDAAAEADAEVSPEPVAVLEPDATRRMVEAAPTFWIGLLVAGNLLVLVMLTLVLVWR